MTTAIVDYGSGNLRSAAKAFARAAAGIPDAGPVRVTAEADEVRRADRVVLPGVGAFADCMEGLGRLDGMREALDERVGAGGAPFLGICVGMQMMARESREHGRHAGLGWMEAEVEAIRPEGGLRVPHMGWNDLGRVVSHPVLEGIDAGEHVYFVHSYRVRAGDPGLVAAETDYGGPLAAALARDNLFGTQFHPEKSQAAGLRLIANFLRWAP